MISKIAPDRFLIWSWSAQNSLGLISGPKLHEPIDLEYWQFRGFSVEIHHMRHGPVEISTGVEISAKIFYRMMDLIEKNIFSLYFVT